jgi:pimeloyl-ACP methyl ester carboxylesterase
MSVVVDSVRLSLRVWACARPSGPPVVLLPATGETAADWDVVATRLCTERLVYAVDLRGHGLSDWPGSYSLQLFADDVIGVLGQIGDEPIDMVGHSLGGLVACKVAASLPGRVRRLVLEDVPLPHPRPAAPSARPEGELAFDWRVVEQVRPEIDNPDPGWADIVARITATTLVIAGGASSRMPQAHVAELADRLPDGQLTTIDGGHLVHATRPEEFLKSLLAFIAP